MSCSRRLALHCCICYAAWHPIQFCRAGSCCEACLITVVLPGGQSSSRVPLGHTLYPMSHLSFLSNFRLSRHYHLIPLWSQWVSTVPRHPQSPRSKYHYGFATGCNFYHNQFLNRYRRGQTNSIGPSTTWVIRAKCTSSGRAEVHIRCDLSDLWRTEEKRRRCCCRYSTSYGNVSHKNGVEGQIYMLRISLAYGLKYGWFFWAGLERLERCSSYQLQPIRDGHLP